MQALGVKSMVQGMADVRAADVGSANVNIDELTNSEPVFEFTEYFLGHTRASGWFADRFGKPRRHFCGDFIGRSDNGVLYLDERLYYNDGVQEHRVWAVSVDENGEFSATSDSLIGHATGRQSGNSLTMRYSMQVLIAADKHWQLSMQDTMLLQPDGSLHNITQVYKWGIRLGTVSAQYTRHDGSQGCVAALAR